MPQLCTIFINCLNIFLPNIFYDTDIAACCWDRSSRKITEDYNGLNLKRQLYSAYTTRSPQQQQSGVTCTTEGESGSQYTTHFKCKLLCYHANQILVFITTWSPSASHQIKGLATKYTTVKWPIAFSKTAFTGDTNSKYFYTERISNINVILVKIILGTLLLQEILLYGLLARQFSSNRYYYSTKLVVGTCSSLFSWTRRCNN